jgi:hypothetical protein
MLQKVVTDSTLHPSFGSIFETENETMSDKNSNGNGASGKPNSSSVKSIHSYQPSTIAQDSFTPTTQESKNTAPPPKPTKP